MEIRVVVKGVRFSGAGTTWRHPFGHQAPYQAMHVVFCSRKMLFFVLFAHTLGDILVPPCATSSLLGARRYHVLLVHAVFVKLHFSVC